MIGKELESFIFTKHPELKSHFPFSKITSLKDKTIVISGASRGIGLAIAKKAALDGANIAILSKSVSENPKLQGTIYTAAKEIEFLGGKALPIQCDVRFEKDVKEAIELVVKTFNGIDILINNASAIYLSNTIDTDMKKYTLMQDIIAKGTFLLTKYCAPYLIKSSNPHILNITQLPNFTSEKMSRNLAYNVAKQSVCLMTLGWSKEFSKYGVGVNGLWPLTGIATAPIKNLFGGNEGMKFCRTEDIMADSAYIVLTSDSKKTNGNFFYDEQVLRSIGINDFSKYKYDQTTSEEAIYKAKL